MSGQVAQPTWQVDLFAALEGVSIGTRPPVTISVRLFMRSPSRAR
jgi:hypothetical protein